MSLPVDLFADGRKYQVALQDLSRSGMFVQVPTPPPVGAQIHVAMSPEGRRLVTAGTVRHRLVEADARSLGRCPGVGITFREPIKPTDELFALAVERLLRAARTRTTPSAEAHVVVADPQTRLLERMSSAFGEAGFSVATATNGMEALAACLHRTPQVVLMERTMPVVDGMGVLDQMRQHDTLTAVPVIMTSAEPSDLAAAFEHGAMDFIAKPFTALEVIARARRLASPRRPDRVVLRGNLGEIPLTALLPMLEQERKTGRLVLAADQSAWIDLVDGRIVAVGGASPAGAHAALMSVLDWTHGTFELSTTVPTRTDDGDESLLPITHLLLEHARLRDEAARRIRSTS